MVRVLVIGEEAQAKVCALIKYAKAPEHWYHVPQQMHTPPGDNPNHVLYLNTYRCVFSFTHLEPGGTFYRHLSISVPGGRYPHEAAIDVIAELFGFGAKKKMRIREDEHALIIAEPVLLSEILAA